MKYLASRRPLIKRQHSDWESRDGLESRYIERHTAYICVQITTRHFLHKWYWLMIVSILARVKKTGFATNPHHRFICKVQIFYRGSFRVLDASVLCLMQWSPGIGSDVAGKSEPKIMALSKVWTFSYRGGLSLVDLHRLGCVPFML